METVTLTAENGDKREVTARKVAGGLAITPTLEHDKHRGKYRLTHVRSGLGFGYFKNLPTAHKALVAVLALPIDWTADKDTIATPENGHRVHEAIENADGDR